MEKTCDIGVRHHRPWTVFWWLLDLLITNHVYFSFYNSTIITIEKIGFELLVLDVKRHVNATELQEKIKFEQRYILD